MDEFDDWPISDEEMQRYNIHNNEYCDPTRCPTCIDIRQRRIHAHLERFGELCKEWRCGHDLDMLIERVIQQTERGI